jgi:hypothetical protein
VRVSLTLLWCSDRAKERASRYPVDPDFRKG